MADISEITAAGAGKKPVPPMVAKKKAPPAAVQPMEEDDAQVTKPGDETTSQDVKNLAAAGRMGDTTLAHLTQGEIVVPLAAQTPELIQTLEQAFLETGITLDRYTVGNPGNSTNPETGMPEYGLGSFLKKAVGVVGNVASAVTGNPLFAVGGNLISGMGGDEEQQQQQGGTAPAGGGTMATSSPVTPEVATAAKPTMPQSQYPSIRIGTTVPGDVASLKDTLMNSGRSMPTSVTAPGAGDIRGVNSGNGGGGSGDMLASVLAAIMGGKSMNPSTGLQEFYGPSGNYGPSMNPKTGLPEFWGPTDNQSILNSIYGYSGPTGQGQGDSQVRQGTYEQGKQYEAARRAAGDTAYSYVPSFDGDRNKYLLGKYYGYTGTTGTGEGENLIAKGDAVTRDLYTADRAQYQPGYKPSIPYAGPTASTTNNSNNSANSLPTPTTAGNASNAAGTAPDYVTNLINQITSLQSQINGLNSGSSSSSNQNTPAVTRVSSLSPNRSNRFRSRRYDSGSSGIARNF